MVGIECGRRRPRGVLEQGYQRGLVPRRTDAPERDMRDKCSRLASQIETRESLLELLGQLLQDILPCPDPNPDHAR